MRSANYRRDGEREKTMFKKVLLGGAALLAAGAANAAAVIDYASLGTAVTTELTAGIAAALAGVGIIWGARIGLRFVRGMFK
jgi:hypothetical protein